MRRQFSTVFTLSLLALCTLAACGPASPTPAAPSGPLTQPVARAAEQPTVPAPAPAATLRPAPTAALPALGEGLTGKSLAGRVLWGDHPVAGVRVDLRKNSCWASPDIADRVASATSDAEGRYEFANPPIGSYTLCAVWPDGELNASSNPGLQIGPGQAIGVDEVTTLHLARGLKLVEPADLAEVSATPIVRWEPFPGIASYHVFIGQPAAGVVVDQVVEGNSLQVAPALLPGTRYSLEVLGLAASGAGGPTLAAVSSSFVTAGAPPAPTADPRGPYVDSVPPDCQPRTVPGSTLYLDPAGRYCFLYPSRFEAQTTNLGQREVELAVVGPALDKSADPLRAVFQISVSRQPGGKDLKAAVDDYLKQFAGLPGPAITRQDFTMGSVGEMLEVVPGRTGARVVLAFDNGDRNLYQFSFMPSVRDFPQAAADVEELFETVTAHFAFLLPAGVTGEPAANPPAEPAATPAAGGTPDPASYDCSRARGLPRAECEALVAIYRGTGGSGWLDRSGWLQTDAPCEWFGVGCVDDHVDQLNLMNNRLAGPIPPQIADLTALWALAMWNNRLTGPIPAELGRLGRLSSLDLSQNPLDCPIPPELGQLTQLRFLSLVNAGLTGQIPETFGNLAALEELKLPLNRLEGPIPAGLAQAGSLAGLDLSNNRLSGPIPPDLGAQGRLNYVNLYNNQLNGPVPPGVQAVALRRLWGNQLDGAIAPGPGSTTAANFAGVSFSFPTSLLAGVWPDRIPATADKGMFGMPTPAFIRLALVLPPGAPIRAQVYGEDPVPAIYIYNVKEYAALNSNVVGGRILDLLKLLRERPSSVGTEVPVLPMSNAVQQFRARLRYLDFANGQGLRFITQYSNGIEPVNNEALLYVYQGMTADGKSYVAGFFPLTAPSLPATGELSQAQMEAFVANLGSYRPKTIAALEALNDNQFDPDLALLDEMFRSLRVP